MQLYWDDYSLDHENYHGTSIVYATMPVCYSQIGMFDILIVTVINWIMRTYNLVTCMRQPTLVHLYNVMFLL